MPEPILYKYKTYRKYRNSGDELIDYVQKKPIKEQ